MISGVGCECIQLNGNNNLMKNNKMMNISSVFLINGIGFEGENNSVLSNFINNLFIYSIWGFGMVGGIRFDGNYNNISHNAIFNLTGNRLVIGIESHGYNHYNKGIHNIISGNNLKNFRGLRLIGENHAIYLSGSKKSIVSHNVIANITGGWGVLILNCNNARISFNEIKNCKKAKRGAIHIDDSSLSTVNNNIICENNIGIVLLSSHDNTFFHNDFFNNNKNADDPCHNIWDNGINGNYWDDYNGVDSDGDGIGDTPYSIPGGDNVDHFPLMEPYDIGG